MEDQVMVSPMSGRYWRNQDESKCCFRNKSATTGSLTKVNAKLSTLKMAVQLARNDNLTSRRLTCILDDYFIKKNNNCDKSSHKMDTQQNSSSKRCWGTGGTTLDTLTWAAVCTCPIPSNNVYDRRGEVMICVRPKKKYRWTHYY